MKELKTIWTIESGTYSDHSVLAVFDDEATAKKWRDAVVNDEEGRHRDAWVGSIQFVESGTKPFKLTTWRQSVELWDNGRTETRGPTSRTEYPVGYMGTPPPPRPKVRYVRAPCHENKGGRLEVVGGSEQSVVKVVSERLAMWKAGAWAGPNHEEINE